jgi:hypothetical protein
MRVGRLVVTAVALLVAAALPLVATAAAAQSFGASAPSSVRVETQPAAMHHGQPRVEGYVYNERYWAVARVLLLVEQLDEGGAVVASQPTWVSGSPVPFGRAYFEARVPALDAKYRVRVVSVEWNRCGD